MNMRKVILLAIAFVFISACGKQDNINLISGIKSGLDRGTVENLFLNRKIKYEAYDEQGVFQKLKINNFSHLGFDGELHLQFFKGKLATCWFYPAEWENYNDFVVPIITNKDTNIEILKNIKNKHYILWKNSFIENEMKKELKD